MLIATEINVGNIIKLNGKNHKVLGKEIKGTGKFGKTIHLKTKSLDDGNVHEESLRAEEKVEDCEHRRVKMQYVYKDHAQYIFMNLETYEQFPISEKTVGKQAVFLRENSEIDVDFVEDQPVSIDFPKVVEIKVTVAPPPVKGAGDSTYKEVELENDLKVLVPQFIKEGETIRLDTHDFTYVDRVTTKSMKSEQSRPEKP